MTIRLMRIVKIHIFAEIGIEDGNTGDGVAGMAGICFQRPQARPAAISKDRAQ